MYINAIVSDHTNPRDMRGFASEEFVTSEVRVGAFTLPRSMVSSFNNYQNLPLDTNRVRTPHYVILSYVHVMTNLFI